MRNKYINHVTLNSGSVAQQRRSDIEDEVISSLSDVLDAMLQGSKVPIPGCPGYFVYGVNQGPNLIATICAGDPQDRKTWVPLVTTGVAVKSRSARKLWDLLHKDPNTPVVTDPGQWPPVPFVADRIESLDTDHLEAFAWTGDFCRSLAWAWADYRDAKSD